ncbi:hypothetical protein TCAL_13296, partial [Tigriopus californicus]
MSLFKLAWVQRGFLVARRCVHNTAIHSSSLRDWSQLHPVALNYLTFEPSDGATRATRATRAPPDQASAPSKGPIVICHGMLGCAQNWSTLARLIANRTERMVLVPDARNHGQSPKLGPITYPHLAADLRRLCHDLDLNDITLIGHSLGGRTAMLLALLESAPIKHSCVHPTTRGGIKRMNNFLQALANVDFQAIPDSASFNQAKAIVDRILARSMGDQTLRSWLLMNLTQSSEDEGKFKYSWSFDVHLFEAHFEKDLVRVPGQEQWVPFGKPTLFLGGAKSNYIPRDGHDLIRRHFPGAVFDYVADAGHFVHVDNPEEFLRKL